LLSGVDALEKEQGNLYIFVS